MYQLRARGLSGFVVTPKSIQEYVALLDNRIAVFDVDIQKSPADCLDLQFLTGWGSFVTRWKAWMANVSWVDRLWLSTQETAEQFGIELNAFLKKFAAACDRTPSVDDAPIPGADQQETLKSFGKSLVWTAGGVLALYATFKILQSSGWSRRRAA